MRWRLVLVGACAMLLLRFQPVWAQTQTCNGVQIADDAIRCPDGSIPSFGFGSPSDTATAAQRTRTSPFAGTVFGVWHTNREGLSYKTPIDVPGASALNVPAGVAPGDLTIDPNGAFVWNTTRPMSGRWLKGNGVPVVLLDTNENKRWRVELDVTRLKISDGKTLVAGQR